MNRGAIILIFSLAASAHSSAEPLKTAYPKPPFGCGPVPRLRNMEPSLIERPWVYDLPPGCSNVASGRAVSSNDPEPVSGELAQVTDGIKSYEDDAVVTLYPGPRWIQMDLGKETEIYAILVWHDFRCFPPRAYKGVIVQIADNPKFQRDVTTIFNADCDNLNGQGAGKDFAYVETNYGRLFDAKGRKARYVRLWSCGNAKDALNCYIEVEVWGR